MGSSGYSETEKIKILYEESLKDIRELTARLENVSLEIQSSASIAHEVEELSKSALREASETFQALANKEMKRAGDAAIEALSGEVGRIAQTVAGDAAAVERYNARTKAVGFVGAVVLLTALIFSGGGFLAAKSVSSVRVNAAEKDLAQANLLLENANKRVDATIAELAKKSADEISKIRAASGWAGTPTGQLAKNFFDIGSGIVAAACKGDTWDIVETTEGNWCVPKRRDLIGGDSQKYGWKIP